MYIASLKSRCWVMALVMVFASPMSQASTPDPVKSHHIVGRVESALITDQHIKLKVRMDTGATTSSLSATDISIIKKDDTEWVHFTLDPTRTEKIYQFELPLVRYIKIRKRLGEMLEDEKSEPGDRFERRPTVKIPICLGNQMKMIEVSLTNRSHFTYPVLLGRSGMKAFDVLIDPDHAFITKPTCPSLTDKGSAS